ncbi:MAG: hypothetical protein CSA53_01740 [Gammaproteobacteria bacterium]|nr:MAG: hypothetical protein CSA53_01740 [Gammaproteobacteria bacterium]
MRSAIMCFAALAALGVCSTAFTQTLVIDEARTGLQSDGRTRLVLEAAAPIAATAKLLQDGEKLQISLPGSVLADGLDLESLSGGLIANLSTATDDSGLLVTLAKPVSYDLFPVSADDNYGYRTVLDLRAAPASLTTVQTLRETPAPQWFVGGPETQTVAKTPPKTKRTEGRTPVPESKRKSEPEPTWRDRLSLSGTTELLAASSKADDVQQITMQVEPRWDMDLSFARLVAIGRLRIDLAGKLGPYAQKPANYSASNSPFYNSEHIHASLREFYLDMDWGRAVLRLGKQQVVWGQADGIKVLDVVNPQSFREFILDDFDRSRIPLWMVNIEHPFLGGDLQWLLIPDSSTHELADPQTPFAVSAPRWVPQVPEGLATEINEPDQLDGGLKDGDTGLRFRHFLAGWDVSLNYLYHYDDFPVPHQAVEYTNNRWLGRLNPSFARSHLVGASASTAFADFTLRAEIARESERWYLSRDIAGGGVAASPELSAVIGLDWRVGEGLLSVQWFGNTLEDYRRDFYRERHEQTVSALVQQSFMNELWELRALALYSLDYKDSLLQLRLKYWLDSNLEVFVGADVFSGTQNGLFGQFSEGDRVLLGMRAGF